MTFALQIEKIAPGADNVGGLLPLRQLSPPLFLRYRFGAVYTEWYGNEGERNDSRGYPKGFGLPTTAWTLEILTPEELEYLYTLHDTDVTIFTLNKWPLVAYGNYNAHLHVRRLTPAQWRGGFWQNVVLDFLQCQVIT